MGATRIGRRTLLQGGGFTITLPLLSSLLPRGAARAAGQARRIIFWWQTDGTLNTSAWMPSGGATDFKLGALSSPLEAIKSDVVLFRGITSSSNGMGDPHVSGTRHCLTGGGRTSIDQVIGDAIAARAKTPYATIQFGVGTQSGAQTRNRISYRNGASVSPQPNPNALFMQLFGSGAGPARPGDGGSASGDTKALERLWARRKSVLDGVREELTWLGGRLGSDDRRLLAAHTESIFEVETALSRLNGSMAEGAPVAAASCGKPNVDLSPIAGQSSWTGSDTSGIQNFDKVCKVQEDLMMLALQCDLTRVATMMFLRSVSGQTYPFLNIKHKNVIQHRFAHDAPTGAFADQRPSYEAVLRWRAEQFTKLVQRLKATPDPLGGGSMFDNTILFWTTEMGEGRHSHSNLPYVLAGRGGGALRTGRYLTFGGEVHTKVLVSLAQAMGVTDLKDFPQRNPLPGLL